MANARLDSQWRWGMRNIFGIPMCVALLIASSVHFSCRSRDNITKECCNDISLDRILDRPPIPDDVEAGRVNVEMRFDNKGVVATLVDRDHRIAYFYSEDEGITWHRDRLYQELHVWQTHILKEGEVLPWMPNPADVKVKYRTIHFPERRSYEERSTDDGKSWIRMKESLLGCGLKLESGGPVFYHPRDPLTFYISGNLPEWKFGLGMFVTVDGGDSFRFMYPSAGISALAISRSDPAVMYGAGMAGSLLKSTDGGKYWDLVGQNDLIRKTHVHKSAAEKNGGAKPSLEWPTDIEGIAIDPLDVNKVYVVTGKGILRTENGGETWCILDAGIDKARAIHSIVNAPGHPSVILVGTYRELIRSVDRGCHWEPVDVLSRAVQ